MNDPDSLKAHAERIRASGILGRSSLTQRLFDYLVECSLNDKVPKEIEVAIDAFGRSDTFDVTQDAVVRVYIHKLRRKLHEFYAGPGKLDQTRVIIPKGEYRLAVTPMAIPVTEEPPAAAAPSASPERAAKWLMPLLIVSLVANLVLLIGGPFSNRSPDRLAEVRASALWAPLLDDNLPIHVVTGDYYIFGEVDQFLSVTRLVRDFNVNSRADLERALQQDPALAQKYQDLNLAYLPTASAFALRDVMPILSAANSRVRVVMASDVNADLLKSGHVVYIGYLSGMGTLQEIAFTGSRLVTGESYDELHDRETGASYVSDVNSIQGRLKYRDYGYLSTFPGPSGNQFIVIAGTRDIALMRMSEIATNGESLAGISVARPEQAFETLYEVYGFGRTDIAAAQVLEATLDTSSIWRETTGTR